MGFSGLLWVTNYMNDVRELPKYMYDLRQVTYYFCQADSLWMWD